MGPRESNWDRMEQKNTKGTKNEIEAHGPKEMNSPFTLFPPVHPFSIPGNEEILQELTEERARLQAETRQNLP